MLLHYSFDLDIGAVLDRAHPPSCLSELEEKDLRNLAFPEVVSHSSDQDSSQMYYTFHLRQKVSNTSSLKHMSANQFHFSYGYVLFKKRRDAASKRGWVQESYVVVSELNLIGFFYKLLDDLSQGWEFGEVFR